MYNVHGADLTVDHVGLVCDGGEVPADRCSAIRLTVKDHYDIKPIDPVPLRAYSNLKFYFDEWARWAKELQSLSGVRVTLAHGQHKIIRPKELIAVFRERAKRVVESGIVPTRMGVMTKHPDGGASMTATLPTP